MIDALDAFIVRIAARIERWRTSRVSEWSATWKQENPGRCMYCWYTHWARDDQNVKIKLDRHDCIEGKGPPHPLPEAKALS